MGSKSRGDVDGVGGDAMIRPRVSLLHVLLPMAVGAAAATDGGGTTPRRPAEQLEVRYNVEASRAPRSTSWTSASSGTFERADARSTRASPLVVGRASTRTARRRSSCAEPKRTMKRALVGETPHVQGSRHREPTVASPGTTFAQRAAAPSRSTPWTPTRAASWRRAAVLAP
mmetsp:Transcript_11052/g.34040  ORF Transcript_11052/g.34040 Transcript_11052/m.34040 type:complete len:172 (+) Transcript_11052:119-634(+)